MSEGTQRDILETVTAVTVYLREANDSFKLLNDNLQKIVRINAEIANTQGMKTLEGVGKQLSNNKTRDSLKQFGTSLKTMASAQFLESLGLMTGITSIFEALFSPLSLISPLLEVIAAIVQEAMAPTLIEMAPYIKMAAMYLIENKDAIIAFIQVSSPLLIVFQLLTGNAQAVDNAFKTLGIDLSMVGEIIVIANDKLQILRVTFEFFGGILSDTNEKFIEIQGKFSEVLGKFKDLGEDMKDAIGDWKDKLVEAFEELIEDVIDEISWSGSSGGGSSGGGGGGGGFRIPLPFGL